MHKNKNDDKKGDNRSASFFEKLQNLENVGSQDTFNSTFSILRKRNEDAHIRIKAYQESIRNYLGQFRTAVLQDFKFNRKHDRTIKKWLIYILFVFYAALFLGIIFIVLAFICGWGITENLSELFKISFLGVIVSGAVSLLVIVFKYIFNKTDDVFYKYSVELYKHIVKERCSPPENEDGTSIKS